MEFLIATWVCCGVSCAIIAEKKYRDQTLWFFLGILFGVFALVAIALLPAA
ncbi:MAG: hypothetical protein WBA93_21475 [Microcoleaceae cyanobacterium]